MPNTSTPSRQRPHFACIPEWVLYHPELSDLAKLVYAVLDRHVKERGGQCWPSVERLAELLGRHPGTIRRATKELREAGITETTRRGLGLTNLYELAFIEPEDSDSGSRNDARSGVRARNSARSDRVEPRDKTAQDCAIPIGTRAKEPEPRNQKTFAPTENRPARNPNPVWDALLLACGWDAVPPPKRSGFGRCVRDLQAMGATPEDIAVRAQIYRRLMPDCVLTPFALVNQWGTCNPAMAIDQLASPTRQQSRSDAAILAGVDASFAKRQR